MGDGGYSQRGWERREGVMLLHSPTAPSEPVEGGNFPYAEKA